MSIPKKKKVKWQIGNWRTPVAWSKAGKFISRSPALSFRIQFWRWRQKTDSTTWEVSEFHLKTFKPPDLFVNLG